jgi:hypothetical protein
MRSSRTRPRTRPSFALIAALALLATEGAASADPAPAPAYGFGVERLYTSAPGAGWFVMDSLDMHGALGGVLAITGSYANEPLRIASADGSQRVPVVSSEASALLAAAVTYDRFRLSFTLDRLFVVTGRGATIGGYKYTAPAIDPGTSPDGFADSRVGIEARLLGSATSAFRLGLGAQLFIPSGDRDDYFTDATWRGMGRVLFAGDIGRLTYAGQLGIHIRTLNDEPAPGSPRGSELLYGIAGGVKLPVERAGEVLVVGPELFGETALRDFFDRQTSDLEGLLSARFEPLHAAPETANLRFKLGVGAGLDAHFGAPQWRTVASVEVFDFGK